MYNKVILAGNLSRDIEIKYTQGGSAIANTAIASTRKYKAQDGTQKEEVLFIDLTFYGRTAEVANQYLQKGSKILIDGRLKFEQWTAQDGSSRSKHKIDVESLQMLGSNEQSSQPQPQRTEPPRAARPRPQPQPQENPPQFPEMSDEIPF